MAVGKNALEGMKMDELLDLKERVEQRIQDMAQDELQTLEDKMARLRPLAGKRKSGGRGGSRGKAPIKYRDSKSGNSWSGRGMTPVWLREYEAKGKSREDFAV